MPPIQLTPLTLAVQVIFACAIAYLAKQRGRHPLAWFVGGVFGGFLTLVLLIVLPDLEKRQWLQEKAPPESTPEPRTSNPQVTESNPIPPDSGEAQHATTPIVVAPIKAVSVPEEGWFVAVPGGQAQGPLNQREARQLAAADSLLVWHEELQDWTPFPESLLA